jgi:curved DNA-binding protein CbpA
MISPSKKEFPIHPKYKMGQAASLSSIPEAHIRIYMNLLQLKNPGQTAQMIRTLMSSPEHADSAKKLGIYGNLLYYCQIVESGGAPPKLPGFPAAASAAQPVSAPLTPAQLLPPQQRAVPQQPVQQQQGGRHMQTYNTGQVAAPKASEKGNEKAMNYFSACLRILELEEEVALTEASLKVAYKKSVIRAHPDKGGSEQEFEAVTRAYAYLGEILRRMNGGRSQEGKVEAPTVLHGSRANEEEKWRMAQPVSLNPDKLDMKNFNNLYEQTRMPDPEEAGYGDWLKGEEQAEQHTPQFSGKFNREVFHKVFEEEAKKKGNGNNQQNSLVVQEMSLASRLGFATELGRTAREDFTVTAHEGKMQYTDLKKAYTQYNTFSHETANAPIHARSLEEYSSSRKAAPPPLTDHEMASLQQAEIQAKKAEEMRKMRMAQEAVEENDYFERMKRLVIKN